MVEPFLLTQFLLIRIIINQFLSNIYKQSKLMMRVKSISTSLKMFFSNQPKNIPKPNPIQFNFNIPKKSSSQNISQINQKQQAVKITKVKRNVDINKILKKKKQGEQYKAKVAQSYQQAEQDKIKQNIKTARYHQEQYLKGQHLLENIPLDPYYSYKLADFQRKVTAQKEKFKQFISKRTDYAFKAQAKFQMAELYHQKQQKYQVEQFLRYLDEYPGSPKGPLPQDDIQYYLQYAKKKMPAIILEQIQARNRLKEKKEKQKNINNMDNIQYNKIQRQRNFSDILGSTRSLQHPPEKQLTYQYLADKYHKIPIFKDYQQLPQVPQLQFNHYQQWMRDLTNWNNFTNYYTKKHSYDNMLKQLQYLNKVYQENDPDPQNQWLQIRGNAPSLMRYYNTLPKWMQEHPGLKDIYLGLQFHCPYIPYEEKQQALNYACTLILPLQKVSLRAMEDFINQKKKFYLNPFLVDKMHTINPQFTWDIKQFFAQIKRQQLKGQSMIKQNEGEYPEPPQIHLDWQNGTANLPVDYYENDDGFWDQIISEKLKRQDQAKPIMKVRKHFTH